MGAIKKKITKKEKEEKMEDSLLNTDTKENILSDAENNILPVLLIADSSFSLFPKCSHKMSERDSSLSKRILFHSIKNNEGKILVTRQKDHIIDQENILKGFYFIGVLAKISLSEENPNNKDLTFNLLGLERVKIKEIYFDYNDNINKSIYNLLPDVEFEKTIFNNPFKEKKIILSIDFLDPNDKFPKGIIDKISKFLSSKENNLNEYADISKSVYSYAQESSLSGEEKQIILEKPNFIERLIYIIYLQDYYDPSKDRKENASSFNELDDYLKYIDGKGKELIPENIKLIIRKEISKIEPLPPSSSEYYVSKNYIDYIISLP
jgi:ATP-dependent Lon protease